ncbi:serine/threonine protein kinase [Blastopirellula marina DSM 3645]|uniref:non-specific serine/threonine protein kinase n=1 Tax=Blastopirellula marina DSM 3645 TaxID=314230 RepID=A3ZSI7_9BACT|nr:serine/threonine protein kinase [Blastopirellula marina DSM 3645]
MTIDQRILDLIIQWEAAAASGRTIDIDRLAAGDAHLALQLQRHISDLEKVAWLNQEEQVDAKLDLPNPATLRSVMLLPEDLGLDVLRENLERSELIDADILADLFQSSHAKSDLQLCSYLVESGLLTRFQLRAIAHGTIRGLNLGRYVILDKIGEGGMGQVFKAHHRRMARVVALKVLPRDVMTQHQAMDRFEQEVQVAAQLHHKNIVRAYDADEAEGLHFFVMEYVEGCDLNSVVRSDGPLPIEQAVDCVLQTAHGLEYAHGVGLVHRDIKPANLLRDQNGVVKILDMGIARLRQPGKFEASLTQDGTVMGTVDFMAPEQAISSKSVTPQADLYSLGCTLYYLLTGRPPFGGDTLMVKLLAHREQTPPKLSALRADVPPELEQIYQKCLAKSPLDRYLTAKDLIIDLQRIEPCIDGLIREARVPPLPASDAEIDTTPTGLLETLPRLGSDWVREPIGANPERKRRLLYGGLMGAALALVGWIGFSFFGAPNEPGPLEIKTPPIAAGTSASASPPQTPLSEPSDAAVMRDLSNHSQIDLLSRLKLPDHAVAGKWEKRGTGIVGADARRSRLMLPYSPQGSYRIQMEFTRLNGNDLIGLHLPVDESSCELILSGWGGDPLGSGLRMIDAANIIEYPPSHPAIAKDITLDVGVRNVLDVRINVGASHQVKITAKLGDRTILDWQGSSKSLSCSSLWPFPSEQALGLLVFESTYEIHSLQWSPLESGVGE